MRPLACLAALFFATVCHADLTSHRQAASDVIDVVNGPAALRAGVGAALAPMLEALRQQGAPEGAVQEFKVAVDQWVERDLVWDDIKPRILELYVRAFSEDELRQLLAFYRSPVGAKALQRFPAIFAEGAKIGQDYARAKQETLNARFEAIADKYNAGRKPATNTTAQ